MKALIVIVSGVPGGGKTTLARQIADHLGVPHLNKDIIRDGLWFTTHDRQRDLDDTAFALFLEAIERWVKTEVSVVADQTLYRGVSESDIRRVVALGAGVNVHVRTPAARDRFRRRAQADPRNDEAAVVRALERWDENLDDVSEPLELGCPVVEIDTTGAVDIPRLAAAVIRAARR